MYDAVIIGGGIVGGMIARALSRYELKVCILEKENDVSMGATKANSAIVHAGFDAEEGSLKAKLNVRGSEMMEGIAKELGVKYVRNGSLVLGFDEEDKRTINILYERGVKNGVRDLKIVDKTELKSLEPNASDNAICALYAPTGAITCPYELCIAAIGNAMDNGAELIRNFNVEKIVKTDDGYEIISGDNKVSARYVINAAGLYAHKIAEMAGDNSFKIHPRKGEYILLDKEAGGIVSKTIFKTPSKMGKGILVSPTVDGNLLTGPTSEDCVDKENKSTTQEGLSKVIKGACENVDGIKYNKSITSFCGLRAVGDTGDFIIRFFGERFINVAGIESPGLSASPAIAEYVVDMLKQTELEFVEKKNFNPCRRSMTYFRDADIEEKNRMIRQDSSYGKIVCRCEQVTEGEIKEALKNNPKALDMDGIKRRTRAQMGRCQGGFCSPRVAELIADELNIPFEEVTKFGGKSVLNTSRTKEVSR